MSSNDDKLVSRGALQKRKLRHGFKAKAKREAIRLRREHGFHDYAPLDWRQLAQGLDVQIYELSSLSTGPRPPVVAHLLESDPGAFSAATVPFQGHYGVLLNDAHPPARQASNVTHELSHIVLGHDSFPPLNEFGCREHHADVEAEAAYMGSVLLVTDEAVMRIARAGTDLGVAAQQYGISRPMMQWRYNDSGARRRLQRERG